MDVHPNGECSFVCVPRLGLLRVLKKKSINYTSTFVYLVETLGIMIIAISLAEL